VSTREPDRERRFRALYDGSYVDVLHFAQRRVHPSHAEDVVADAFLVAWRRLEEVPRRPDDARAWLFGIVRHCLLNVTRGLKRQNALAVRIAETAPATAAAGPEDEAVVQRLMLAAAWRGLSPAEQETLSLCVFDDLTSAQAARLLGINATSYRLRLLRARRALRRRLDALEPPPAAVSPLTPTAPTWMETQL
jgi:RNA polymerase sigma-70 factor (ECF subfamily)